MAWLEITVQTAADTVEDMAAALTAGCIALVICVNIFAPVVF